MNFRVLLLFSLLPFAGLDAGIIYVNANAAAGGDGASWESAFQDLQDALDLTVSGEGDQVWIAAGVYYPDKGQNVQLKDYSATFIIKNQVALFGGFEGNEDSLETRDWNKNKTRLSGSIETRTSGSINRSFQYSLNVCTIEPNDNGAMIDLDGLTISEGMGSTGGAVQCGNFDQVNATNCTFSNNSAQVEGGVAYGGIWTATNCTFSNNSAQYGGGVAGYSVWTATNCTFSNNSAQNGGVAASSSWTAINCIFYENIAFSGGVDFESVDFTDQFGNTIVGRFYASNCSFSRNSADVEGGIASSANCVLLNCILDAENIDPNGAMFSNMHTLKNTPADISTVTAPRAPNLIEGFSNGDSIFEGFTPDFGEALEALVIDADPLFVDTYDANGADNIWGTQDDGLRLQAGSPAIDQGNHNLLPLDDLDLDRDYNTLEVLPVDLIDQAREQGGGLDLGAFEFSHNPTSSFTLISTAGIGGTVTPAGATEHPNGSIVTITASPAAGYIFNRWSGDVNAASNPLNVTIDTPKSITANFAADLGDSDNDGINNYFEIVIYGSDPNKIDTSGDGFNDKAIVDAGYDPTVSYTTLFTTLGYYTEAHLQDLRTGSLILQKNSNNLATLQLQIERSEDLTNWTQHEDDLISVPMQMNGDKQFFRFAMPQE